MSEVGLREATPRSAWIALAITLVATAVAMLVDRTAYQWLNAPTIYDKDLGRLLRVMGFSGTWILLALAVGLHEGSNPARRAWAKRRAWLLFWSPTLAGALAELIKIVVRRERPGAHDGLYGFRPWDERTWSTGGLGFASSHAAVAFGGAAMLARLFPRARWVGYGLAIGCAATRVLHRAHFVSDVVFAAGLGWLSGWLLWRFFAPADASASASSSTPPNSAASASSGSISGGGVNGGALLALLGLLSLPTAALGAQSASPSRLPSCSYESCALNVVPRWNGLAVVRGADEAHVATLGFFFPGSLEAAFSGVPTAEALGSRAVRTRWAAALLTDLGAAAILVGALRASGEQGSDDTARLWLVGGAAALGVSVPLQFRADGFLSRAAWQFNAQFAR
ncbi:MAG: phosphatase PAP2 family protein [Gemmatimonadaceae bacterium]|nr:phosphatase PAP2 family protein [Gemmatimonadaceae bacterium]